MYLKPGNEMRNLLIQILTGKNCCRFRITSIPTSLEMLPCFLKIVFLALWKNFTLIFKFFYQTEDPLSEATKYLKLIQKNSADSLETHLLSFEVNLRKQKVLLAFQVNTGLRVEMRGFKSVWRMICVSRCFCFKVFISYKTIVHFKLCLSICVICIKQNSVFLFATQKTKLSLCSFFLIFSNGFLFQL